MRPLGYVTRTTYATGPAVSRSSRDQPVAVHSAADAHGWYDLDVTAEGEDGFRQRLIAATSRTGRASVSG
ncbi:phospholipase C, phosphocholine-specific [Streptomyces californicus]